jgi:hypothetical protein
MQAQRAAEPSRPKKTDAVPLIQPVPRWLGSESRRVSRRMRRTFVFSPLLLIVIGGIKERR